MREEYFAVDPPGAVRADQYEEVGVAGAAPILGLQPSHRGGAHVFDGDDARLEIGGRPTLPDSFAEFLQRPGDRLAGIAAADARPLGEGRAQEPRVAVSGAVDKGGPAADLKTRVVAIEYRGTAAMARLEAENWRGTRYTDFFVLVRTDGSWRIDSKVFFAHSRA